MSTTDTLDYEPKFTLQKHFSVEKKKYFVLFQISDQHQFCLIKKFLDEKFANL